MEIKDRLDTLALIKAIYSRDLRNSENATAYLLSRISPSSIRTFNLGFCASKTSAYSQLSKSLSDEDIKSFGIFAESESGIFDRFYNRIIFPINAANGPTLGFVARALADSKFKYLNTEDNLLFKRSDLLFGLDVALPHILKQGFVFICEGLFDVIAMHEAGFKNVVASLGTTVTKAQIQYLSYFTDSIVIVFDGDTAGKAGAIFTRALAQSLDFRTDVIELPENEDPSSLLKSLGEVPFKNFINTHFIL